MYYMYRWLLDQTNDHMFQSSLILPTFQGFCAQSYLTLWTEACQAPLSMGFPRQEYGSGFPFPSPGDLPKPGTEPESLALVGGFFTLEPAGMSQYEHCTVANSFFINKTT